jgi:glycine/D-amino acid oxidase-like deaminating enzyme
VQALAEWRRIAQEFGGPSWYAEELTGEQAARPEPSLRVPPGARTAYFASAGFVHGDQAVQALLGRAQAGGAGIVRTDADVVLETRGSEVTGLRLPGGDRIRADVYVC